VRASLGNLIYLCCRHHPAIPESFLLAIRDDAIQRPFGYFTRTSEKTLADTTSYDRSLQKWLSKHATCGGTVDHFTIAYAQPHDHDLPKANPVRDAVHLHLVPTE
jgi:hypothetical protein